MAQRHLWGVILGSDSFVPDPGKSSRRIWWLYLSPGGSFTRIRNASCLLQTGWGNRFKYCLNRQLRGGKYFLQGPVTHPGSRIVPVLLVSTSILRHNLIWMLYRVTWLGKKLSCTVHLVSVPLRLHFINFKVPPSSFKRILRSETSRCTFTVWRASDGRERSQVPYLVPVHGRDEEGEGNGSGRHGVGRGHSKLSNHSLLQFHHGRG